MNKDGVQTISAAHDPKLGSIDYDNCLKGLITKLAVATKRITVDELSTRKTQIKLMKAAN